MIIYPATNWVLHYNANIQGPWEKNKAGNGSESAILAGSGEKLAFK